jgi:hypothetical protein
MLMGFTVCHYNFPICHVDFLCMFCLTHRAMMNFLVRFGISQCVCSERTVKSQFPCVFAYTDAEKWRPAWKFRFPVVCWCIIVIGRIGRDQCAKCSNKENIGTAGKIDPARFSKIKTSYTFYFALNFCLQSWCQYFVKLQVALQVARIGTYFHDLLCFRWPTLLMARVGVHQHKIQ